MADLVALVAPVVDQRMSSAVDHLAEAVWALSEYEDLTWEQLSEESREVARLLAAGLLGAWMDARGLDRVTVAQRYLYAMSEHDTLTVASAEDRAAAYEFATALVTAYDAWCAQVTP